MWDDKVAAEMCLDFDASFVPTSEVRFVRVFCPPPFCLVRACPRARCVTACVRVRPSVLSVPFCLLRAHERGACVRPMRGFFCHLFLHFQLLSFYFQLKAPNQSSPPPSIVTHTLTHTTNPGPPVVARRPRLLRVPPRFRRPDHPRRPQPRGMCVLRLFYQSSLQQEYEAAACMVCSCFFVLRSLLLCVYS